MLVEFKVENFRSFQSEQTFSLVASKDDSHPDNLIGCDKFSLVKAAAIYGPNASGKSTLINALKAMQDLVVSSATQMNVGDSIKAAIPFCLDKCSTSKPSRFEITLLLDGTTYFYGFAVAPDRVCEETLDVRKSGGRITHWFERRFDASTQQTTWKINGPLKRDAELLQSKTRDNCLLLSRGADFNTQVLIPLFSWFRNGSSIFDLSNTPYELSQLTAKLVFTDPAIRQLVLELIRDADFGIESLVVTEEPVIRSIRREYSPQEISREYRQPILVKMSRFRTRTGRVNAETHESVEFDLEEDESNGTRRFFALVGPIFQALDKGRLLVIDELDCSMHPLLTRKLIELFQNGVANSHGGQLVFTTHDSSMMDSYLFRRDQIWFTEKSRTGASDLFSLYDFKVETRPRKFTAIEKNYLVGRYGGIPKFGPTLESLDVP